MNRFVYSSLICALSPALLAWMALRARRAGGQWQVAGGARFGFYAAASPLAAPVWVHAVSLGETRAAQPLVQALLDQERQVLLTHLTATGRAEGQRLFGDAIAGGRLAQEWLPYDFPGATRRFFSHYRPRVGVLIEREVWPNLLFSAGKAGLPMVLASARFSDQSLRQALRAGSVLREAYAAFSAVYAQTLADAQRLEQAGANGVRVSGNFKFDVNFPQQKIDRGRSFAAALGRRIVVVASTREGEDELFIQAIKRYLNRLLREGAELHQRALFCLVPRHPQRFDEAAALLTAAGLTFVRRSDLLQLGGNSSSAVQQCRETDVLLGDSLGEMPWYYALGNVAIVAGSFQPHGGQNLIEACAIGVPVIVGPHTVNFEQAVVDAIDEGAALRVPSPEHAVRTALELLDDAPRTHRMGAAGRDWVQKHAGAVSRVLATINELDNVV